ncbi:MFS transporter [Pseudonocardia sp. ICBG162]|uniref:MFS transporter n=1 Tax=Pseudonocardia sp. ICBG162 TaxID=2846761 RepID=UPI0027E1B5F1|nr:MFS transporter [Pseudonocardia sp. ICBG162]
MDDTAEGAVDGVTVTEPATMRRAVAAAAVGNITEWFDFGVYGYLATTIEAEFFPPGPLSQVAVFATFAIAFFFRPLGGLFFGPLGDRIGRTKVLSITVILMALGTFLIGLIPSYASIGLAAPILLVAARVLQGFSTGGEYAGAMTFIAEYAPDRRRGYLGSFLELGTFVGYALGATIASVLPLVLSPENMSSWGWRIPFFVALPLGIVGVYLRVKLEETPAFQNMLSESEEREGTQVKDGLKLIFTKYLPTFIMVGGVVVA